MSTRDLIKNFREYLQDVKRFSKNTVTSYLTDLNQYEAYLANGYGVTATEASHHYIRSWIVDLLESGVSEKSVNRKISSLRSFYNYLKRKQAITINPMQKVIGPKVPKRLPKYVDKAKINSILDDQLLSTPSYADSREMIIINLLYHTGMRRAELLSLTIRSFDMPKAIVKVLGKGNKERIVPLNDTIVRELENYLALRSEKFPEAGDVLILTDKGKPAYPKLIYNIVRRVLKKYNATEKASPHVLRHTFATHLTANGADLNAVKELLGHASLAATQVYTHNSIERLKEVYDKSHPKSKS